jgi:2-keto-4-pentenoate hydratase/2-oxohepta-3-ene-1,7-dioic acid hydratase in catechol pathway
VRIARFSWNGQVMWGVVVEDTICDLEGELWGSMKPGAAICPLSEAKLLAPLEAHNKVIGLGLTYKRMYASYEAWQGKAWRDGPAVFMKPPNTIVGHMDPIVHHEVCTGVIYEAEVGIVIGKVAARVSPEEALEYVAGYTCVNDVTAAGFKTVERPIVSTRFKICDTFCPTGPLVETDVEDPAALTVLCRVNGEEAERSITGPDMCYTMGECIAWVTSFMTLMPGDIIATGSNGTGRIEVGDVVEVEVEGIGVLRNPVVAP